jgi:hypothetical protein
MFLFVKYTTPGGSNVPDTGALGLDEELLGV